MTEQINLGKIWASAGGTDPVTEAKYEGGWVAEIPSYQNFNYMVQGLDKNILALAEAGLYNWQADISYKVGVRVISDAGTVFTAKVASTNTDPDSDSTNSTWVHGWLVGSSFSTLAESDGFKVELPARTTLLYTGRDQTVVNKNPMVVLETTEATENLAVSNVAGELVVSKLGTSGPDNRDLAKDAGYTYRLYHEGHKPVVAEVAGAVPEAPTDGKLYARVGVSSTSGSWVEVTSTVVQNAPPPPVTGAGQGWYNLEDGQFYLDISDGDSSQWVPANPPVIPELPDAVRSTLGSATRNSVLTPDVLNIVSTSQAGFSVTKYVGNGSTLVVDNGVDISSGDFGGIVFVKNMDAGDEWMISNTVTGATQTLSSDSDGIEFTDADGITAFGTSGFTLGADADVNTNTETYISFTWQTNKEVTGVTNGGKAYTSHYNAELGVSITKYVGDGVFGHIIPHHLGKPAELTIVKNRDSSTSWPVFYGSLTEKLLFDTNSEVAATTNWHSNDQTGLGLGGTTEANSDGVNYLSVSYVSVEGVTLIDKYVGTGQHGNTVECGFKPAWVVVKNLSSGGSWVVTDSIRGDDNNVFFNESIAEEANSGRLSFTDTGFVVGGTYVASNADMDIYIFMAVAETSNVSNKAISNYDRITSGNQVTVTGGTVVSHANGFDGDGELNFNELISSDIVVTLPANLEDREVWIYKSQGGGYGISESRPLEGLTRDDADKWGEQSIGDTSLRTTARHIRHSESTGVAYASTEQPLGEAWKAFSKGETLGQNKWLTSVGVTTGWLAYKMNEKRVLKSYRWKSPATDAGADASDRAPKNYTLEGSNDGSNWTVLETVTGYVATDGLSWQPLVEFPANVTPYQYYMINVTLNNGDNNYVSIQEVEFNTVLLTDYYLVTTGKMYNYTGTAILRTYLGSVLTDTENTIVKSSYAPAAKVKANEAEFHGKVEMHKDLVVNGNIISDSSISAWAYFNGDDDSPILHYSTGVLAIVEISTGRWDVILNDSIDLDKAGIVTSSDGTTEVASYFKRDKQRFEVRLRASDDNNYADGKVTVIVVGGRQ